MIGCANLYQTIAYGRAKVPAGVVREKLAGGRWKGDQFMPAAGAKKLPCLIYVHGGAFSCKASAYHKKLACRYAMEAECKVFFPDYPLTPKHPYLAAYREVLSLYQYVTENAEKLGVDRGKIGLAGDSAGASIAALICNRYEREGLPPPCLQMLIYPCTDGAMSTDSMKRFPDTPLWNGKNNRRMWAYYTKGLTEARRYDPSPMHCPLPDRIPNTYLETAEYDCLHDEGVLYGKRLREAGANVEIRETKGTVHGYDVALGAQIALRNIEKRILFLRRKFYGDSPKK